jgi:hypothetical protein
MRYTLVFGTPVMADGKTLGNVERIIVEDGVAKQFTVNPGLFGTGRVLPLSDVQITGANGIELRVSDDVWKAYPAFNIESLLPPAYDTPIADPGLTQLSPQQAEAGTHRPDNDLLTTSAAVPGEGVTVPVGSAVVSAKTSVLRNGTTHALHGLVLDTGRPVQVLVADGQPLDVATVRSFTSEQISVG